MSRALARARAAGLTQQLRRKFWHPPPPASWCTAPVLSPNIGDSKKITAQFPTEPEVARGGGTCANPASVWAAPPAWVFPHGPLVRLPVSRPRISAPGQPARLSSRRKGGKHSCEAWPPNPGSSLCFRGALRPQPRGTLLTPHPCYLMSCSQLSTVHLPGDKQGLLAGGGGRGPQCLVSAQGRSWSTKPGPREQARAGPAWGVRVSELPVPGGMQAQAASTYHPGHMVAGGGSSSHTRGVACILVVSESLRPHRL